MAVFDLFSKRQRALRGDVPDVYTYDDIPVPLRVQIVQILRETLGGNAAYQNPSFGTAGAYDFVVHTLRREYGVFQLPGAQNTHGHSDKEVTDFLLSEPDAEWVLDAIELLFKYVDRLTREWRFLMRNNASEIADAAIEKLNVRFREHGVGYQFEGGEIIRVDSQFLHAEVVKPAFSLLKAAGYAGAQAEFLSAHEHYRHGRAKETLGECLKAFESTMKAICAKRGWKHDPKATAKPLLDVLFDNGLIPAFWKQHFGGLRSALESGVPTGAHTLGRHGQGEKVIEVPEHIVGFVMHSTAAAIVFLVEAEKTLP